MDVIRVENDGNQSRERFMFKEPLVLLQLVCLSLLSGIACSVTEGRLYDQTGILQVLGPLPALILVTFLSEICGRKPIFFLLFALSALSSILSYLSIENSMMEHFVVAALKGGVLPMTILAICEYSSPMQRFAYLVANVALKKFGARVVSTLLVTEVLSTARSYLSLCLMLVALACLVSVYWWPESPYWLAQRGRREEAAAALRWLRGEGEGSGELRALLAVRQRRSRKLFWLALFISILSITVAKCSSMGILILFLFNYRVHGVVHQLSHFIITVWAKLIVSLVIVLVSYKVKRKVVYLGAAVVPLALLYIICVCIYAVQVNNHAVVFYILLLFCTFLLECGPFYLSLVLCIEFIPQKYYAYISYISYSCFIASHLVFPKDSFSDSDKFPLYGYLLVFASLALAGVAMLYWLSSETGNTNLFEIEELYLRRLQYDKILKQVQMEELVQTP